MMTVHINELLMLPMHLIRTLVENDDHLYQADTSARMRPMITVIS